jgi:hypothetical protein
MGDGLNGSSLSFQAITGTVMEVSLYMFIILLLLIRSGIVYIGL